MNKYTLIVIALLSSFTIVNAQNSSTSHNVYVQIENNAFMCPNLSMKINRTLLIRKSQISNWKVADDYNSATFITNSSNFCNKDSIVKMFVKESEYPFHIINSIKVDGQEIYRKGL